ISFATQPHGVSLDGDNGHSPYTSALAAAVQHPNYGLFRTFNEVGLAVEKVTHGDQLPWVSSSPIDGRFYFAGKEQASLTQDTSPAPAPDKLRRDLITDSDRLAAMPSDTGHAPDLRGIDADKIDIAAAIT